MKKIVKLFGLMTIAAALLISCKPSTDSTSQPAGNGGDAEVKEKVFTFKAEGYDNCSNICLQTELKEVVDAHSDAKLIITVKNTADADRTGWGCGVIFVSSNPNNTYESQGVKIIEDYKPVNLPAGGTEEIELVASEVLAKLPEGGCLSYNLWNDIVALGCKATW